METISFPAVWQQRWGSNGAILMQYLQSREPAPGEWFRAEVSGLQEQVKITDQAVAIARVMLRADGVIDCARKGPAYQYKINHQKLNSIEKGN